MGMGAQGLQPVPVPKHDHAAWYTALLACSISAAFVGGSSSYCCLALFIECSLFVLSYSITTNLSKRSIDSLMEGLIAV